jgi:ectoine hydroxylase-related dioxygenase (phytanoyl-CoA dioxygenase family)
MNYYLGHEVGLAFAQLHGAKPDEDKWYQRMYEDVACNPRTRDLHFDSFAGTAKCILYLDDVDEGQGPFSYVPGSHRWECALLPRVAAEASSYANDFTTPLKREAFAKLPPAIRHDAQLGYHIMDEHPLSKQLLEQEELQTSSRAGHLIVFDPSGLHRGGQCRTGNRICVALVFMPVAEVGKSVYPF